MYPKYHLSHSALVLVAILLHRTALVVHSTSSSQEPQKQLSSTSSNAEVITNKQEITNSSINNIINPIGSNNTFFNETQTPTSQNEQQKQQLLSSQNETITFTPTETTSNTTNSTTSLQLSPSNVTTSNQQMVVSEPLALGSTAEIASSSSALAQLIMQPPQSPVSMSTSSSSSSLPSMVSTTSTTTTSTTTPAPSPSSALIRSEEVTLEQQQLANAPKSERQHVLEMFNKFFTRARSHDDQLQKEFVRDGIIVRMRELGFQTSFLQKSRFEFRRRPAFSYNMISILPGKHRETKEDSIVLIGAHWDSATKAPGVDDNGSGSTCLLEIARLLSENRCSFNHTVMLVWFDYEEQGKFGSEFFVNDYLFPLELEKYGSKFIGAFIMDMILVRDKENNTQSIPLNLRSKLTEFSDELEREKYRGDFLATWARKTHDEPLEGAFRSAWIDLGYESRTFKAMRPELPQSRLPNSEEKYEWKDFFRSDHASFWFPPLTSTAVRRSPNRTSTVGHSSLNAILLTDLGPWRKSYAKCYHSACDDEHLLTDGNLSFMQQVIDTLVLTLLRVGQGECSTPARIAATHSGGAKPLITAHTKSILSPQDSVKAIPVSPRNE